MNKANLKEAGHELTIRFNHEPRDEAPCSCDGCQQTGWKYVVDIIDVHEGEVEITDNPNWVLTAKMRVKSAAFDDQGLCDDHFGELVRGELVADDGIELEFQPE